MKKIKIAQLITGLGIGGAEKVLLDISKELNKYENIVLFIYSISDRKELLNEFESEDLYVKCLNTKKNVLSVLISFFILFKEVKKNRIDIIHAHMAHPVIIASLIKLLLPKVKIVFTSHNFNIGGKIREIVVWLFKPLRNCDILFSKEMKTFFYQKNFLIIPNGVFYYKYQIEHKYDKEFTFISIARLEAPKNHGFLIDTIYELNKEGYSCKLFIAGDGSLKKILTEKINKLKLSEKVFTLGIRTDIPELLSQSHCLVLPSLWEGLPICILEAGAAGTPIISTPVGSISSILNSQNSYLVELKQFKSAMIEVMVNFDNALIKANQLKLEINNCYDIPKIADAHFKLYKSLVIK